MGEIKYIKSAILPMTDPSETTTVFKHQALSIRKKADEKFMHYRHQKPPTGMHDFHNIMWDPHVYRGPTLKDFRTKNDPTSSKLVNCYKYCREKGDHHTRRMGRRRFIYPTKTVGGILRPTTADVIKSNPCTREGFHPDLTQFIIEPDIETDYRVGESQTDEEHPLNKRNHLQNKLGRDAGSQIFYRELIPFNEEAKDLVSVTSSKVMEQSILEFNEDEELGHLRDVQTAVETVVRNHVLRVIRLEEREQKLNQEIAAIKERRQRDMLEEKDVETRVGCRTYSQAYLRSLLGTMERLKEYGAIPQSNPAVYNKFIPWLNTATRRGFLRNNGIKDFLDDIIRTTTDQRPIKPNSSFINLAKISSKDLENNEPFLRHSYLSLAMDEEDDEETEYYDED